jgi:hypothetical protein
MSAIDKNRMETGGNANTHGFINVNPTTVVVSHEGRKDKIGSGGGDTMIVVNLGFLARGLGTKYRYPVEKQGGEREQQYLWCRIDDLNSRSADCEQMNGGLECVGIVNWRGD